MSFRLARKAQEVADRLIGEHHGHLQGVTVTAVFVDKVPTSKGRQVWARAKKIGGLNAFLIFAESVRRFASPTEAHEYGDQPHDLFVLEVAEDAWSKLTEEGREALIDEALCSCEIEWDEEGNTKLAVVGPDVSGFRDVVKRHGLWREDLEEFVRAGVEQLSLDAVDEAGGVQEEGGGEDALDRATPDGGGVRATLEHNGRVVDVHTGEVLAGGRSS
ncbi:hypothetical protein GBA65_15050 [Rubrobacter marinus]|uniref:Putative phage metallopeptidase domain-containing protein n=1 Tax=Rubrobacter marinus TaxID=2653852 RepID=A0A6G8PZJ8_9ACTN|nr:putative metallopeptidase [Rubrobacter marinus]QIN79622.1 hypothetical protein GBA65_15050 [Rubrobacter marinus]